MMMMKHWFGRNEWRKRLLCWVSLGVGFWLPYGVEAQELSKEQAQVIGKKIWRNECAGTVAGLTSWNRGEGFASMGIAHFIWYPEGKTFPFEESFPRFLEWVKVQGVELPGWLEAEMPHPACPWSSREVFEQAQSTASMKELRAFLVTTVPWQAQFVVKRLKEALPQLLASLSEEEKKAVKEKWEAVAASPAGLYALVDYVNFKGEGTNPRERYQGMGWGLLQVLEEMKLPEGSGKGALALFREAAQAVLTRRVANASPRQQKVEQRFLSGWKRRIDTYQEAGF